MYDIITIGSATRDVFIRSRALETHDTTHSPTGVEACLPLGSKIAIDEIHFTTGGGATNAAVTFARLGKWTTACVARIGAKDTGGRTVLIDLRHERVTTTFIQRDRKLHTAYSIILLTGSGERSILSYRGASEGLSGSDIPWTRLRTKRFYLTSLGGDLALARRILDHAARIGARVAWNPGSAEIAAGWTRMAPLIAKCDVLNLNREEAAALTGIDQKNLKGILTKLWSVRGPACPQCGSDCDVCEALSGVYTLITDGSGGAYVHNGHTTWHIASRNLEAVNTTGAGDAFGSAFFLGLDLGVRKNELGYALDYALPLAMANAEGVITHMGGKAGILSKIPSRAALAKYRVRTVPLLR